MSEYWKSQPKKFCEFCKCWITDNKPSVQFHEKGKRHQENVKLKIEEARKKGSENEKRKQKENSYLERMEKAAMAAFKKDLEDNPELAKQYKAKLPQGPVEGPQLPENYVPAPVESANGSGDADKAEDKEGEWYEAMSEMGYPYYWNTTSGESIWVAPEKYVSLVDQGLAPPPATEATSSSLDPPSQPQQQKEQPPSLPEEIPLPPGLDSIPLPGELPAPGSGESSAPPAPPAEESSSDEEAEGKQDRNARGVYGTWARVQQEQPAEYVDLQLPKTETVTETIAIPIVEDEPRIKFKEKRVTSLGSGKGGPVAFKKRKLGDGARNVRRRNDDD